MLFVLTAQVSHSTGKKGRKQSVLKKNCPKKESKFKGVKRKKKVPTELNWHCYYIYIYVGIGKGCPSCQYGAGACAKYKN